MRNKSIFALMGTEIMGTEIMAHPHHGITGREPNSGGDSVKNLRRRADQTR